jgi:hypothetical protein
MGEWLGTAVQLAGSIRLDQLAGALAVNRC